ncbi:FAD-dependent oxidoreductase [Alkalihalobacillus sp. AL-G]|uniref:FAD-dependent oxidoreductase n=1 Tax=Alkalihalobacillus sp. AL-G TaxID=2926399 RepID=UPI00272CCF4C|nr:FAD-dependent oxidoreductase [Alkalihalobacillus sp. AL-G]WLD91914.1 hypothetical protein MOJ78_12805 [Alkalihalobacillus sp. AL-G]
MAEKILLIGGGYSHLHFLKRLKEGERLTSDVTLLLPKKTDIYSKMLPGLLEGIYQFEQLELDFVKLATDAGVTFVKGKPLSIDAKQKMVLTDEGEILNFDVVSFDMDSASIDPFILKDTSGVIDPTHNEQVQRLINEKRMTGQVVIAGGKHAGIELSFSIQAWKEKNGDNGKVILINRLREQTEEAHQSKISQLIQRAGIQLVDDEEVQRVDKNEIVTQSSAYSFDTFLCLPTSKASKLFRSSKLPVDEKGKLIVEDTLQVKQFPFIFGTGASVTFRDYPNLPCNHASLLKQGSVLFDNIKGYLQSGEGYRYTPPKRTLSILSTGNRKALLSYGKLSMFGYLPWLLRDRIDRKSIGLIN